MRLFKCYDPDYIDDKSQVLVIWARCEKAALKKCAEIHKNLDYYDNPCHTVLNNWKVEEFFPAHDATIYVCYPSILNCAEDVEIVPVSDEVANVEEYIMDWLSEQNSKEECFKDYNDIHIVDIVAWEGERKGS